MCCEANWKREYVPDHKFDFINVREFHRGDFMTRLKYIWKYILILKAVTIMVFDIFTATTMILSDHWTNAIQQKCGDNCAVEVQFNIAKWIFVGCIIFSFLLYGYEAWKAKKVIQSRDISYAFTNLMANDYYSLKSYDNFCLFCHINNSTKKTDDFAFFIYFTFKDWKRLLLADGPRQSINALTLYSFAYANGFQTSDLSDYWDHSAITAMLLFTMIATVLIFAGSLILLIAAAVLYVPFLCYIQGNLKEYVCHKVDKRISEIIKKKQRDRIRRNAAMEKKMANGSIKNGKDGDLPGALIPQPTLPNVTLDDDDVDVGLRRKMEAERGNMKPKRDYVEYDVYNPNAAANPGYLPSLDYNGGYDDYSSSTNLAANAAPLGISYPPLPPPQPTAIHAPINPYASSQPAFPPSRSQSSLAPQSQSRGYYEDDGILAYDQHPVRSHSPHQYSQGHTYDQGQGYGWSNNAGWR